MRAAFRFIFLLALLPAYGQLPVARLSTVFPPGTQIGAATEVKVSGVDLDDARELHFSNPGISATFKSEGLFTVIANTNVPIGIYDVCVVGRFGASNPRAFVIGDSPEITSAGTNKSVAAAQEIPTGGVLNGRAVANAPEFFKFKARQGQRLFIQWEAQRIDSKMDPELVVYDLNGKELRQAHHRGPLDFSAPIDGEFILKIYDQQFRGGDEFWYRLELREGPWIDFTLPTSVQRGSKSKITLFGRNLRNGKPSEFKAEGRALEQLEVEVQPPQDASQSYLNRPPEAAMVEGFEYRLASDHGFSNPIFLSIADDQAILESEGQTNIIAKMPCEIDGQFFPRNDVDVFQFEAAKGDALGIELFSQRLGLNTDPFALLQRVTKNDKGEEQTSDVHELYGSDENVGGREFDTATRDPAWRFEVKEDGLYRLMVRDLFGETISDPKRLYRLAIRKDAPDFALIAYSPAPPQQNKDSKEIAGSGLFLRRGDSIAIRILALRRDNYGGPIEIGVEGLPSGVSTAPLTLDAGANSGWLIVSATESASPWIGPLQIVGKAKIGEKDILHRARSGAITWNVGDYQNERVVSELTHQLVLSVSGAEIAPLAIKASEKPLEAVAESKVNAAISIARRGEFNGPLKFKALLDPVKEFEVDGKATNATFEIDLKQAKLGPGFHTIPVYATSPGKYRRLTIEEAKAIEAEIKTLSDSLAGITEAPKKEAANAKLKTLEAKLQTRDLTATVWASLALSVMQAPQKSP